MGTTEIEGGTVAREHCLELVLHLSSTEGAASLQACCAFGTACSLFRALGRVVSTAKTATGVVTTADTVPRSSTIFGHLTTRGQSRRGSPRSHTVWMPYAAMDRAVVGHLPLSSLEEGSKRMPLVILFITPIMLGLLHPINRLSTYLSNDSPLPRRGTRDQLTGHYGATTRGPAVLRFHRPGARVPRLREPPPADTALRVREAVTG